MCKRAVNPNPAFVRQQSFRIRRHLFRWYSRDLNISGFSILVLWEGGSTDILVMWRCAVGGCDCHGPSEIRAYFLQHICQLGIFEYRIWAVLTRKLFHFLIFCVALCEQWTQNKNRTAASKQQNAAVPRFRDEALNKTKKENQDQAFRLSWLYYIISSRIFQEGRSSYSCI